MKVKVENVLPQHNIGGTAGTASLSTYQKSQFEVYSPIKVGQYSKKEREIVLNNWDEFCRVGLSNK